MYQVTFQRGCNSCKKTTGIPQFILVEGDHDILNIEKKGSLLENDLQSFIKNFYNKGQFQCEVCGSINQFKFYEIEVNGQPVKRTLEKIPTELQRDTVSSGKSLLIIFEAFEYLLLTIDVVSQEITSVKFENPKRGAFLYVHNNEIKIHEAINEVYMNEIFKGQMTDIKYSDNGEIFEINGNTQSFLDGTIVTFKIVKGISSIGKHQIGNKDNFYVDIESCEKMIKFKSNFLLTTIKGFGPLKQSK